MAEKIIDRCSRLNILDEEDDVADLNEVVGEKEEEKLALTLVGRVLIVRTYNFEALQKTLKQIWPLSKGAVFRTIESNLFAIQFFHWKDKEKVLAGAPWSFDQNLIILKEIAGDEQPSTVNLNHCPFGMRLYNLPFDCRSNADTIFIAQKIREVLEIEDDDIGWEKSRRVRILLDVNKPLRRVQRIKNKKGDIFSVNLKYKRLPIFVSLLA
ncbi:Alpha-1 2-mannosyltransferase MNN21 [Bienertia sinuspersici]